MKNPLLAATIAAFLSILTAGIALMGLSACQKQKWDVDMTQIVGRWSVNDNNTRAMVKPSNQQPTTDSSSTYDFGSDGSYTLLTHDVISGLDVAVNGKYELQDRRKTEGSFVLSLFEEGDKHATEFVVLRLNTSKMKWRRTYTYGANPFVELTKYNVRK